MINSQQWSIMNFKMLFPNFGLNFLLLYDFKCQYVRIFTRLKCCKILYIMKLYYMVNMMNMNMMFSKIWWIGNLSSVFVIRSAVRCLPVCLSYRRRQKSRDNPKADDNDWHETKIYIHFSQYFPYPWDKSNIYFPFSFPPSKH